MKTYIYTDTILRLIMRKAPSSLREMKSAIESLAESAIIYRVPSCNQVETREKLLHALGSGDEHDLLFALASALLFSHRKAYQFSEGLLKSLKFAEDDGRSIRKSFPLSQLSRIILGHLIDLEEQACVKNTYKQLLDRPSFRNGDSKLNDPVQFKSNAQLKFDIIKERINCSNRAGLDYRRDVLGRICDLSKDNAVAWVTPGLLVESHLGGILGALHAFPTGITPRPCSIYPEYPKNVQTCRVKYGRAFLENFPMPWEPNPAKRNRPGRHLKNWSASTHFFELLGAGLAAQDLGVSSWSQIKEETDATLNALVECGSIICKPFPSTMGGRQTRALISMFDILNLNKANYPLIKPWYSSEVLKNVRQDRWGSEIDPPSRETLWDLNRAYATEARTSKINARVFLEKLRSKGVAESILFDIQHYGLEEIHSE